VILLDTQVVAWLADDPGKLSIAAQNAIRQARRETGLAIADKTLWELAMMVFRRRVNMQMSMHHFLMSVEQYCQVLPITAAIAERSMHFGSNFPKDPSDQLIAATAIVHGIPLVTADAQIRNSGEVPCIW
jgi:PIN domain nuclease of toxin-antitoxin system